MGEIGEFTLRLSEEERQLVLLALARLSFERRGFETALNDIASRIDNVEGGRAQMYDGFRRRFTTPGAKDR